MKFIILFILLSSNSIWAQTNLICDYENLKFYLELDKGNDINVSMFKDKTKIETCHLKVSEFNDGKTSAAFTELYRFEKLTCGIIYDKIASQFEVSESGYIKRSANKKLASAYILKNKQPLKCKVSN